MRGVGKPFRPTGNSEVFPVSNIRRIVSSSSLVAPPLTFAAERIKIQPQQATIHRSRNVAVSGINRRPGEFVCTRLSSIHKTGWMLSIRFAFGLRLGFKAWSEVSSMLRTGVSWRSLGVISNVAQSQIKKWLADKTLDQDSFDLALADAGRASQGFGRKHDGSIKPLVRFFGLRRSISAARNSTWQSLSKVRRRAKKRI